MKRWGFPTPAVLNLDMYQNTLEGLLKHRLLGPIPAVSYLVCLEQDKANFLLGSQAMLQLPILGHALRSTALDMHLGIM